ncbi:hypothetical protein I4U23_005989 [Adineta vaga]|nr:hypothetical protein I4U23_005989 [Adineta vaga]
MAEQLITEEDEQQGREQEQDLDLINYLKEQLVRLHTRVSSYGTNIVTARGIQKLSSEFEILVFGPARVGKSTLIKEVSGDERIATSAEMNACTEKSEKYIDKYNIHWWDTPGFENWSVSTAKNFFQKSFHERGILPKVAIFCRTANVLGSSDVIKYMFEEIRKHGILLLYVITKWPFIPKSEQNAIVQEAVSLLGGHSKGIYRKHSRGFRALECEPKKSYIMPVNSKVDEVLGMRVPRSNLNTLRKILITKLDEESQGKLIELYKNNTSFWTKLGYGAIEIIDDFGVNSVESMLTEEENLIYKQVKNGENPVKAVAPILKLVIDKVSLQR